MDMHRFIATRLVATAALTAIAAIAHAQIQTLPYSYGTTLSAASPTYNRPQVGAPPTLLSGVGTAVSYGTLSFIPDTTGSFTFDTTAAALSPGTADDTFLILYQGIFNPATPLTNAIVADDDAGVGALSLMTTNLTAGTTYILVTTTFDNGAFGNITTRIAGPGTINLGSTAAAPEPGSLALLGLVALPGVALLRRKK